VSTTKATSLRSESLTTNHSSDTGLGFDWLTFIGVAGTAKAISGTTKDIMSAVDIVVAGTAAAAEEESIVAAATIAATKGIQEETAAAAAGAVNTKEEEVKKVVGATVEPSQSRGRPKQKTPPNRQFQKPLLYLVLLSWKNRTTCRTTPWIANLQ
jgi:hypothetical protein